MTIRIETTKHRKKNSRSMLACAGVAAACGLVMAAKAVISRRSAGSRVRFILTRLVCWFALTVPAAYAQTQEPVIQPQVERRDIRIPKINVDDIEVGVYGGILSVQDFGSNAVIEGRLTYHVTEDFFIEGTYGRSKVSDESFRHVGIPIFTQPQTDLTYYHLSVGYNLFPGEIFFGKNWAMTSAVYLIGGVGNVDFNDENNTAFNFGIGIRVLPKDWLALRAEMRDMLFQSDILGNNEIKHNFQLMLGVAVYF